MNPLTRLLFSSVSGVLFEKVVAAVAAVASNHLFAKIYGASAFGELQFALSLATVAGSGALLFSAQSVAPVLSKYPRLRHALIYRTFRLRLVSSTGIMLAFFAAVWLLMDRSSAELAIVTGAVLIAEPLALGSLLAYNDKSPWVVSRARTLASAVRVMWLFAAAHLAVGPIIAAIAWPIEALVTAGGPFRRYRKLATEAPKSQLGDRAITKTLLTRGARLWPAVAAAVWTTRLDRVLLGMLISKTDLGIYSASAALLEQWNAVGIALAMALGPSMVFVARNEDQLRAKALKLGVYLSMLGAVAFLGSLVIGRPVFMLIYGPAFETGAPLMIYACGCSIVLFADYGFSTWLVAAHRYRLVLIKQVVTMLAIAAAVFAAPKAWILFAPSTAVAVSLLVFWCYLYGRHGYRARQVASLPPSGSLPDPNL